MNLATGARWVTRAGDDGASLAIVDADERVVVDVDRSEWAGVGFDGDWTSSAHLLHPDALRAMTRGAATRDGGRWYEQPGRRRAVSRPHRGAPAP